MERPAPLRSRRSPTLRRLTDLVIAAVLVVSPACTGDRESAESTVTRRDSAGVEIVRSSGPTWTDGEGWRIDPDSAAVELGAALRAEERRFYGVRGLVRLSDGRWVVANGGSSELLFFAPDGESLARVGGEGSGPGEFQRLAGVARLAGDSLAAWDRAASRVSVFDASGALGRSVRLEEPPSDLGTDGELAVSRAFPVGVFSDGSFLARGVHLPVGESPSTGVVTPTVAYMRYGPDGSFNSLAGTRLGAARWMRVGERAVEIRTLPFRAGSIQSVAGDRWYSGDGGSYEIAVHGPGGDVRRLIRRAHRTIPITDRTVAAYLSDRLEDVEDDAARREARRRLEEMPLPEDLPAYDAMIAGRDGHLWVHGFPEPGGEPAPWSVFARDGTWLGDVDLPPEFRPMWIDDTRVAGVWRDELDVEHVRAYRLLKP